MATSPFIQHQQRQAIPSHAIPGRPKSAFERFVDRCGDFLTEYWAHVVMIGLGSLVVTAISIPFLSYFGLDSIAKPLFFALHYVCAQIPSHSIYIFGHQLGLCERNFSIYTSMFLTSLIFVLSKKRMPGIPWWLWILMILPMAWDGTTQMFGWRESDWMLRVITGTLFGVGNIWFALPLMQKSILETTLPPHLQQPLVQRVPGINTMPTQAPLN